MVQLLWKTFCQFLTNLNMQLRDDSAVALLGIYLKDNGYLFSHENLYRDVYSDGPKMKIAQTSFNS